MVDINSLSNNLSNNFDDFVSQINPEKIPNVGRRFSNFVSELNAEEITDLRNNLINFVEGLDTNEITDLRNSLTDFIEELDTNEITDLRNSLTNFIEELDTNEITDLRNSLTDFIEGLDTNEIVDLRDNLINLFDNVGDRNINLGTLSNDELNILDDSVTVFAFDGDDLVDVSQSSGNNLLYGGRGNDTLIGSIGDRLVGGDGNDVLLAGASANILEGGDGTDQFWIVNGEVPDSAHQITNFDLNADVIGINNSQLSFETLDLIQTGNDTLIRGLGVDLAIVQGIEPSEFHIEHFLFT